MKKQRANRKLFNRQTKNEEERKEYKFGGGSKNLEAHFSYSNEGSW